MAWLILISSFCFTKTRVFTCPHRNKLLNAGETRHSRKLMFSAMPSLIWKIMAYKSKQASTRLSAFLIGDKPPIPIGGGIAA